MKHYISLIFIIAAMFFSFDAKSQESEIEQLVSEGVELHDAGKYDEAIAKYNEALKLDKNNPLVLYEMAYAFYASGDYDNAIKYCKKVLRQDASDHTLAAYVILGSAYDDSGETRKAIKTYQEGIEAFPGTGLLHYNLALTYYNSGEPENCEQQLEEALRNDPFHASSHLLLGAMMFEQERKVQTVLPLYFFLLLENDTRRSEGAWQLITETMPHPDAENQINISLNTGENAEENPWLGIDLMYSLMSIEAVSEETGKPLSQAEQIQVSSAAVFKLLDDKKEEQSGFWWDFYAEFYSALHKNEYTRVLSYMVSIPSNDLEVSVWLNTNSGRVREMYQWIENYFQE